MIAHYRALGRAVRALEVRHLAEQPELHAQVPALTVRRRDLRMVLVTRAAQRWPAPG